MIRILCTGDSHTWGQGVSGIMEEFEPTVVAGDLRLASFKSKGYVNLLRNALEKMTGSYSEEWSGQEIADRYHTKFCRPCAVIENENIEFRFKGSMLRLEFRRDNCLAIPEIIIDRVAKDMPELLPAQGENDYRLFTFLVEEGEHTVTIQAKQGILLLYKVESYGGTCAVINSGVGSCPAGRYLEEYWQDHVAEVRPDVVIAEAHTINDWLTGETLKEYRSNLTSLLEKCKSLGAQVVLLTVSPILGEQSLPGVLTKYCEYVEMSRLAAGDAGIKICDANAIMKLCLDGLGEKAASDYLFDDNWHPNERGHALYAELIRQAIIIEFGR